MLLSLSSARCLRMDNKRGFDEKVSRSPGTDFRRLDCFTTGVQALEVLVGMYVPIYMPEGGSEQRIPHVKTASVRVSAEEGGCAEIIVSVGQAHSVNEETSKAYYITYVRQRRTSHTISARAAG